MKRVALILGVVAVLGLVAFRGLIGGNSISWRQQMTVIVDTPNGEKRAASVVEITKTETMGAIVPMEARGVHGKIQGEAVALEVFPGRWLFALLSGGGNSKGEAGQLVYSVFQLGGNHDKGIPTYKSNMNDLRGQPSETPTTVPADAYPVFVTFDDISDPKTVRIVDPRDLEATFGAGVHLTEITLEITEKAVTGGRVTAALPWLCDLAAHQLRLSGKAGAIFDNEISNNLGPGNFAIAGCK